MHSKTISSILLLLSPGFMNLGLPNINLEDNKNGRLIENLCLESFNSQMNKSNKTPPPGMANFSCKCFLKELSQGFSVATAESTCKVKAQKKYKL